MSNGTSNVTLKHPTGPWWTVYGTPGEIAQQIGWVFPDLAVDKVEDFPVLIVNAQVRWAELMGGTGGPAPQHSPAVQAVVNAVDGTVIESGPTTPAPQVSALPAPAAPVGGFETDRWGGTYQHSHPKAPTTQYGPMVLRVWTASSGKEMKRWLDPRDPKIPSVYQANGKNAPVDLLDGDWAKGV